MSNENLTLSTDPAEMPSHYVPLAILARQIEIPLSAARWLAEEELASRPNARRQEDLERLLTNYTAESGIDENGLSPMVSDPALAEALLQQRIDSWTPQERAEKTKMALVSPDALRVKLGHEPYAKTERLKAESDATRDFLERLPGKRSAFLNQNKEELALKIHQLDQLPLSRPGCFVSPDVLATDRGRSTDDVRRRVILESYNARSDGECFYSDQIQDIAIRLGRQEDATSASLQRRNAAPEMLHIRYEDVPQLIEQCGARLSAKVHEAMYPHEFDHMQARIDACIDPTKATRFFDDPSKPTTAELREEKNAIGRGLAQAVSDKYQDWRTRTTESLNTEWSRPFSRD